MKRAILLIGITVFLLVACEGSDSNQDPEATSPISQPTPEDLAATVNGQPITRAQLDNEINARASRSQAADPTAFAIEVLESMINQTLIEQYAAANNIIISGEQVQTEIDALNAAATENQMTLNEITGYPESMLTQKVRENLITQAVITAIVAEVPTTAPQVHARHILVKSESEARDILDQLANGADFGDLAAQYSLDVSTAPAGGDLGWIAHGDLLQPEIEAVLFDMPAQSRWPDPVSSALGYHVLEVLERDETRQLDEAGLAFQQQQAFSTWLETQRTIASITRYVERDLGE
ncbi:MAG: peptidylprolyl isomerase [Anaerolineales bacterium]|nr:peptidylprolyl isomerase [Anaerolineales bacterium]